MNRNAFAREINEKVKLIDEALDKYLPQQDDTPGLVHEAMRYSIFAGGKRLRPVLFLAAAEAVGGSYENLLPAACGLEMIHTYSLIHDDLPAMDNDDYRRGKLTNHKVFGDATAILAGDALLTNAFGLIAECAIFGKVSPLNVASVIREISDAAGSLGMIGGQIVDIQSENKQIDFATLKYIHTHKTGALFKASVRSGALLAGGNETQMEALTNYAENLGLAFQITDDILDVEGDTKKLGKSVGSDERKNKSTYPSIFGLQKSKEMAAQTVNKAIEALTMFDEKADMLRYIASYLTEREN